GAAVVGGIAALQGQALHGQAGAGQHFEQAGVGLAADGGVLDAGAADDQFVGDIQVAVEVAVLVDRYALRVQRRRQADQEGPGRQQNLVAANRLVGDGNRIAQRAVGIADAVMAVVLGGDQQVGGVGEGGA